jgi:proteasome lid subunit RPN8/RPN11
MNEDHRDESSESPEWRVPGDEQLETDAYHVWKPRPLLRSVHWKPVPAPSREAGVGSYDVFIDQRVLKALHQHVWNAAPGDEPLGFLVGDLCEDPDTGRRYLIVSAAVPSRFPLSEDGPEQIQGEALVAMQLEVDRRRGVLAGWYHRHTSGPVELTAEDIRTHEQHFLEPWQIALLFVTDHAEPTGGCFRRTRAGLAGDVPLPFFEMVSNESLLPRGVRRSHMDWQNVETADSIDLDLPARPDPLPEPEPEHEPEPDSEPVPPDDEDPSDTADTLLDLESEAELESPFEPLGDDDSLDLGTVDEIDAEALPVDLELDDPVDLDAATGDLSDEVTVGDDLEAVESDAHVFAIEDVPLPIEPEDVLAELEDAEAEFTLPLLDEVVESETDPADLDVDLPEPGWDSGEAADEVSLPLVQDVDLESFVTEVETADVAAQVDETVDLEAIEPGWDGVEVGTEPVVHKAHEPDLDAVPGEDLVDLEEFGFLDEPREPDDEAEPAYSPDVSSEKRTGSRSRRPMVVVGVLVALAVVVSLVMFVLLSGDEADGPAATEVIPEATAGAGEAVVEEPVESPVATDSVAPASVADVEELGDALLESVSRYYGRAVAQDGGQATCADLQTAYVEVEDRWIAYNVQGRARFRGRLPDELATRDERLYAGVQDVEREFTRSGCERP